MSNNIANANTVGFKKERASFKEVLVSRISGAADSDDGRAMSDLSEMKTDFAAGTNLKTGNPLDIALDGKGFLSIEGGRYTRKGDLRVGRDGFLVTQEGRKVLGTKGPIKLAAGQADIALVRRSPRQRKARSTPSRSSTLRTQDALTELEAGYYATNSPPVRFDRHRVSGTPRGVQRRHGEGNGPDDHDPPGVRDVPEGDPDVRRCGGAGQQRYGEGLRPGVPAATKGAKR